MEVMEPPHFPCLGASRILPGYVLSGVFYCFVVLIHCRPKPLLREPIKLKMPSRKVMSNVPRCFPWVCAQTSANRTPRRLPRRTLSAPLSARSPLLLTLLPHTQYPDALSRVMLFRQSHVLIFPQAASPTTSRRPPARDATM